MISLCEKTGHLIRITKTDRGSGDQYAHCQICGCAVVKGSWNTPWKQPKFKQMPLAEPKQEPMHPEIKKMYEDYFDKCFRESSAQDRGGR